MKISLFTPTNKTIWLPEAYRALEAQNADWEWVILANGELSTLPNIDMPTNDPRVRLIVSNCNSDKVGALKAEACSHCRGDIFVEYDHDDILVPGALADVTKAAETGAGFIYSDVAVFQDLDLKSIGYDPTYGWETYEITVYGKKFIATKTFPITPRSLCEVHYAPDHVRAWTREAYYLAGGHDPDLSVGDDHDLICRTYLAGVKFQHTGTCAYLYRWHDSNTVLKRNRAIQEQQAVNRYKYLRRLITEWCKREGHLVVDLFELKKANGGAIPAEAFKPESAGHILAADILEYQTPEQLVAFFNTVYETLIQGGYFTVQVPSTEERFADQNPFYKLRFNPNTFLYFSRGAFAEQIPGGIKCRFDLIHTAQTYPDKTFKQHQMKVLVAELCALKGQRHPGPRLI